MLEIYKTNISNQPPVSHTDAAVVLISTASNSVKFWLNNMYTNQFVFSSRKQTHKLRVNYSLHILLKVKSPFSFKVQALLPVHQEENPILFQERAAPYSIYQRTIYPHSVHCYYSWNVKNLNLTYHCHQQPSHPQYHLEQRAKKIRDYM